MTVPEFKAWPSLSRLATETVTITEKVDGTNAIIHVSDEGEVHAGSRNRWLTAEADNFGFYAWVNANRDAVAKLGPGYHYGEWCGPGIQRGYGLPGKRWVSFAHYRKDDLSAMHPDMSTVPVMYQGEWHPMLPEVQIAMLLHFGSSFQPGFARPEGIVIEFHRAKAKFKKLCENDKIHKTQQAK